MCDPDGPSHRRVDLHLYTSNALLRLRRANFPCFAAMHYEDRGAPNSAAAGTESAYQTVRQIRTRPYSTTALPR